MSDAVQTHRVLVIAYYFPPLGLSGVQRTLKFIKYLPQYDWHPSVLTVSDRAYFAKDDTLLDELSGLPVNIYRTHSFDPLYLLRRRNVVRMPGSMTLGLLGKLSQTLFLPDNKIGWKRRAVAEGMRIIAQDKIDVIYTTAPPYTDFLIGAELRKRSGLPLVVDYRDAWLDNPLHFYPTLFHKAYHRRLEQKVLNTAAAIITINRAIKEQMLRSYDFLSHHEIDIIPHGYDQQDFEGLQCRRNKDGKLRILYAGTFYYNRSPEVMFRALLRLGERYPETKKHIELHIAGSARAADSVLIRKMELQKQVFLRGYLNHRDSIQELIDADVLWLLIGRGKGQEMMSTGKMFEYLGAMKPILACIPDGSARQTLEKSGAVYVVSPDDVDGLCEHIFTLYRLHKSDRLPVPSYSYVSQFDRQKLTATLAATLLSVLPGEAGQPVVHTRLAGSTAIKKQSTSSISNSSST